MMPIASLLDVLLLSLAVLGQVLAAPDGTQPLHWDLPAPGQFVSLEYVDGNALFCSTLPADIVDNQPQHNLFNFICQAHGECVAVLDRVCRGNCIFHGVRSQVVHGRSAYCRSAKMSPEAFGTTNTVGAGLATLFREASRTGSFGLNCE
ncbi:uncharacterized protein PSFLO_06770 [Pseudozyma flocculosa]|uniref:Uncharacterized protein n=1 Tax=Pseudozyma flocculosa TaxID=84751 RepID=A0A5C3FA08_9BASI|nr:uncharacterized protein PSFLO_06770 [Pseudozyma flocculosa]